MRWWSFHSGWNIYVLYTNGKYVILHSPNLEDFRTRLWSESNISSSYTIFTSYLLAEYVHPVPTEQALPSLKPWFEGEGQHLANVESSCLRSEINRRFTALAGIINPNILGKLANTSRTWVSLEGLLMLDAWWLLKIEHYSHASPTKARPQKTQTLRGWKSVTSAGKNPSPV